MNRPKRYLRLSHIAYNTLRVPKRQAGVKTSRVSERMVINMLTPAELRNRTFSKEFRGYGVNEVDDYIAAVLENYSELYHENAELDRKLRLVAEQLAKVKSDEESIKATIVNAQKMADAIIRDANRKSNEITGAVNDSCEEILADYRKKIIIEVEAFFEVKRKVDSFKQKLYDAYRGHIESIKDKLEIDDLNKSEEDFVSEVLLLAKDKMEKLEKENELDRDIKRIGDTKDAKKAAPDRSIEQIDEIKPDFAAFERAKNESRNK